MVDDERTCCGGCEHQKQRQSSEVLPLDVAKKMEAMGKKVNFNGDKVVQIDNWLKIIWFDNKCDISGELCLPDDVMHNCPWKGMKGIDVEQNDGGEWWK